MIEEETIEYKCPKCGRVLGVNPTMNVTVWCGCGKRMFAENEVPKVRDLGVKIVIDKDMFKRK